MHFQQGQLTLQLPTLSACQNACTYTQLSTLHGGLTCVVRGAQLERRTLGEVGPEVRMVESLAPMWEEQRARNQGATPLQPPGSPPRLPHTLSPFVTDAIRTQYQVRGAWRVGGLVAEWLKGLLHGGVGGNGRRVVDV